MVYSSPSIVFSVALFYFILIDVERKIFFQKANELNYFNTLDEWSYTEIEFVLRILWRTSKQYSLNYELFDIETKTSQFLNTTILSSTTHLSLQLILIVTRILLQQLFLYHCIKAFYQQLIYYFARFSIFQRLSFHFKENTDMCIER